ncbi:hypothetical protein STENM327S_01440 [Streptomyces tendae]
MHLLTYAAVFLTFWHQPTTGNDFAVEPVARTVWYALYGSVTALVLWYRVLTPLRLNLRHRMRVEAVIEETPGIVSVLIGGRRLAVATSGSAERGAHVVDPRTGRSAVTDLLSVTVVAPRLTWAAAGPRRRSRWGRGRGCGGWSRWRGWRRC